MRPRLLSEEIYSTLRAAIVEERLSPGMKIVEERLASELGVSRIPLREALHKLERDGFVVSLAHKGFRVASLSNVDLGQVYQIRVLLESEAAAEAAAAATPQSIATVEKALDLLRLAADANDPAETVRRHSSFHAALYASCRNARLLNLIGPFLEIGFTLRVAEAALADNTEALLTDHANLVDAMRRRDPDAARAAMRLHVTQGLRLAHAR